MQIMRIVVILGGLLCGASLAFAGPADHCSQDRATSGGNCEDARLTSTGASALRRTLPRPTSIGRTSTPSAASRIWRSATTLRRWRSILATRSLPTIAATCYFDAKRYDLAIADYTRAVELDGEFALAFLNRGLAHERLGDTVAAAKDYGQALAIDPGEQAGAKEIRAPELAMTPGRPGRPAGRQHFRVRTRAGRNSIAALVLPVWIEHTTSPLPRECSTTELRQRAPLRLVLTLSPQAGEEGGAG